MDTLNEFEQHALIDFINERPVGNVLRDIAERRLIDLRNGLDKYVSAISPKKINKNYVSVININSGERFNTIIDASRSIKVSRQTLACDLTKEKYFRYPFRIAI